MATLAPTTCCMICGGRHEYRAVVPHRMPGAPVVFGPTEYEMLPHVCPPSAIEAFRAGLSRPRGAENMSWSIGPLVGRPSAVAKKLAQQSAGHKFAEPEETIRQQAIGALLAALAAYPETGAVTVLASGSQGGPDADGKVMNTLSTSLQPIYGFLE